VTLALFRIIEAVRGSIVVDDVDISKTALYPLRSKIVILPQVKAVQPLRTDDGDKDDDDIFISKL